MNEIKIDMDKIITQAQQKAIREAEAETTRIVAETMRTHFRGAGYYQEKPGLAYELIKRQAEIYIISEEFSDKISVMMEKAADEAAEHAVQIIMKKLARKLAFGALNGKN